MNPIQQHNKPLEQSMLDKGYQWKETDTRKHFVDNEGEYVSFPIGFITGPHRSSDRSPRPYSYSVQGKEGWSQRSFTSIELYNGTAQQWALETAQKRMEEI